MSIGQSMTGLPICVFVHFRNEHYFLCSSTRCIPTHIVFVVTQDNTLLESALCFGHLKPFQSDTSSPRRVPARWESWFPGVWNPSISQFPQRGLFVIWLIYLPMCQPFKSSADLLSCVFSYLIRVQYFSLCHWSNRDISVRNGGFCI